MGPPPGPSIKPLGPLPEEASSKIEPISTDKAIFGRGNHDFKHWQPSLNLTKVDLDKIIEDHKNDRKSEIEVVKEDDTKGNGNEFRRVKK